MKSNVTGGIILFLVGALVIAMGVSEKGKRIFNILTGSGSLLSNNGEEAPAQEGKQYSGGLSDPDSFDPYSGNIFGFAGERGASYLG